MFVHVPSHSLEVVEPGVHLLIVPLDGGELVEAVNGGQRVDDVRTQDYNYNITLQESCHCRVQSVGLECSEMRIKITHSRVRRAHYIQ